MGKRFEGEQPRFWELIEAFERLGMANELGRPGEATAYATRVSPNSTVEFTVIPGAFSAREVEELRAWAA